jgi:hypothetical protein
VPASGGGQRTPTSVAAVFPPGQPAIRRVRTVRVTSTARIVVACRSDERLVAWYVARGFFTPAPPTAALTSSLSTTLRVRGDRVVAAAQARRGPGVVQVSAVCAGGR